MRILVVNPNTTASMTAKIGQAACAVAASGTEIIAVAPDHGPVSVEGHYDGAFCLPGLLQCVRRGEAEGFDGFVVACFDDPGIGACRESRADRWWASAKPRWSPPRCSATASRW
jgi:allantoin racemase